MVILLYILILYERFQTSIRFTLNATKCPVVRPRPHQPSRKMMGQRGTTREPVLFWLVLGMAVATSGSANASLTAGGDPDPPPKPPCTAMATAWCNSKAAACSTHPLVAADALGAGGAAKEKAWRCYHPKCLATIKAGGSCPDYCTRPVLASIASTCKLPPPPPPPPPPAQKGKDFISEV